MRTDPWALLAEERYRRQQAERELVRLRHRQHTEHDIDRLYELLAAAAREITRLKTPQRRRLPEENEVDLGYAALSGSTKGELIGRDYTQ
jgi:hypothetical protein